MLYLSTRNTTDSFTAYRALHEARTPDGGFFIPFRLPKFTTDELNHLKTLSACDAIAEVLNLFFGLRLNGWDVECVVGKNPLKTETINQRLLFAEGWRNPESSFRYTLIGLYRIMSDNKEVSMPAGWAYIAIEIALLFGLYASGDIPLKGMDVAVATSDFADITAFVYAKQMGLPLKSIICTTNENSTLWDLIKNGELNTGSAVVKTDLSHMDTAKPEYLECFIYARLGAEEVNRYLDACGNVSAYRVPREKLADLNFDMYGAVVSADRVGSIISAMRKTYDYNMDPYTALAYGGLQDYRARTGENKDTLFLVKMRPE